MDSRRTTHEEIHRGDKEAGIEEPSLVPNPNKGRTRSSGPDHKLGASRQKQLTSMRFEEDNKQTVDRIEHWDGEDLAERTRPCAEDKRPSSPMGKRLSKTVAFGRDLPQCTRARSARGDSVKIL